MHTRAYTSGMPRVSQSSPVRTTSRCRPRHLQSALLRRFHRWVGLSGSFCKKALVFRSFEVIGSHDLVTNGVLDPQPTNLDVSCLPKARSGAHPDRCRELRLDIHVDDSAHLLAHVLREDPSCRAISRSRRVLLLQNSKLIPGPKQPKNLQYVLSGLQALHGWRSAPHCQPSRSLRGFARCRGAPDDRI